MNGQRISVSLLVMVLLGLIAIPAYTPRTRDLVRAAPLDPDRAIAMAMNDLEATAGGFRLRHSLHTMIFSANGVAFSPRNGGPAWSWRLNAVTAGGKALAQVAADTKRPSREHPLAVIYPRGGLVEKYLAKENTIEQQFLIPRPLPLDGADLVIAGTVRSSGKFAATEDGWAWRTPEGGVHLGRVLVYDAKGSVLPASMDVTANSTRIAVDGAALARASYPVTVDPEIGPEFPLSNMGPNADPDYDALKPAVAYNSTDNEFLVVWQGSDDIVGEYEIWGQRLNAFNGNPIGSNFQISYVGPVDDPDYDARDPDVAYNSTNNEYLVVWEADHYADGEFEIFARRVSASSGPYGPMARVSVMGGSVNPAYDALDPAVAYNSTDNEYLVVWEGDTTGGGLANDELEIWGQLMEGDADSIGLDFRISSMGGLGDPAYAGRDPDVAYNSARNEYLVVWEGDDAASDRVDEEFEIWGQRLQANGGATGPGDFRITWMGDNNDPDIDAFEPAIAYNDQDDQFLVVWEGETLGANVFDILGRRLASNSARLGDQFVISNPSGLPNPDYDAHNPAVAYGGATNEYLVVWQDDELGDGEEEIFGQRLAGSTGQPIAADERLSQMGPDGSADHFAQTPAVAYSNADDNVFVAVWSGDDATDDEFEIWAQGFFASWRVFVPVIQKDKSP